MKRFAWAVLGVLCAAPLGAQEIKVFTPSGNGDAPMFANGKIVRIDATAGTVTLRTDSGTRVMKVDPRALSSLRGLRAGDEVIVGSRAASTTSGRSLLIDIRPAGATTLVARRPASLSVSALAEGSRSMGTARVVNVDRNGRRMTVVDSTGRTRVLDVRGSAVTSLGALQPGQEVSLGVGAPLVEGTPAGTVTTIGDPLAGRTDVTPGVPGLPQSPPSGVSSNPAVSGVQPVPGAQPLPGVQGPTGAQPVPNAQPLPGRGATGRDAANPGLAVQPVPGSSGQLSNNAGASAGSMTGTRTRGGIVTSPGATGVRPVPQGQVVPGATGVQPVPGAQPLPGTGVTGTNAVNPGLAGQPVPGSIGQPINAGGGGGGATGGAATGGTGGVAAGGATGAVGTVGGSNVTAGGSPLIGSGQVPQLGAPTASGINSSIPSLPPTTSGGSVVLPTPSVVPDPNVPTTVSQAATIRDLGARDFDLAIATLAGRASELDRAWFNYRAGCESSTVPNNNRSREWFGVIDGSIIGPTEDVCETAFNDFARMAKGLAAQIETARDAARRADVLPGRMREALQRYDLDI